MSEARSFINSKAQNYATLKNGTPMNANQQAKFDVLNAHIVNTVVLAGELVIVGDPSTPSCTSHEAFLMGKAAGIHRDIVFNGGGVDGFMLDNFEMLQSLLAHASMGAGAASDGWARHLEAIKRTLEQIEQLHREHMSGGAFRAREAFTPNVRRCSARWMNSWGRLPLTALAYETRDRSSGCCSFPLSAILVTVKLRGMQRR